MELSMVTYPIEHGPPKKAPSRTLKALGIIGGTAVLAVAVLLYSGRSLIEHLPQALRSVGSVQPNNVTCVVYERPPRTGSSTIGQSLRNCLHSKGYDWGRGPWMQYHEVIPFMLARPSQKKAIVTRHFVLPFWQLRQLLGQCSNLLWISSTRGMRNRMLSKAKFDVRGKHGSSELEREKEVEVVKNLGGRDMKEAEELYERYPYVDDEKMLKILPDYIVRSDFFEQDLEALLQALGCVGKVKRRNVHSLNGSDAGDRVLENIELRFGDRRHRMMNYLAGEVNERGLEMAKEF